MQDVDKFADVAVGRAPLSVVLEERLGRHLLSGPSRDEPELMQKQFLGALEDDEHAAAGTRPHLCLVRLLVGPHPRFCGWPADRPLQVRFRPAIQGGVVAYPCELGRATRFERCQKFLFGKPGIEPHGSNLAELALDGIEERQIEFQSSISCNEALGTPH